MSEGGEGKADLGAWELQSTWEIFLMQPLVKGLTPPRNFPVTYGEGGRGEKCSDINVSGIKEKKNCLTKLNDAECDAHNQLLYVPVHLWSYHGPLTLCGTQSGQRPGQKTDQPHTLQPY